jgi:hypothetical protein
MKNLTNALLALIASLLLANLIASPSQAVSTPKTYDALKLAQYVACINSQLNLDIALIQTNGGSGTLHTDDALNKNCNYYKPA